MPHSSNLSTQFAYASQIEIQYEMITRWEPHFRVPKFHPTWQLTVKRLLLHFDGNLGETNFAGVYHTHHRSKIERCVYLPVSCRYWLCHAALAYISVLSIQWWQVNIVDTPGHADFGAEVERILNMVSS